SSLLLQRASAPSRPGPLSLHDALPISSPPRARLASGGHRSVVGRRGPARGAVGRLPGGLPRHARPVLHRLARPRAGGIPLPAARSEEHTSELQSLRHLVCRLLLEKTNT